MDTSMNSRQDCIEECLRCYRTCFEMAMTHCLEMGGRHVAAPHFRIMMACSEICRTTAHFMLMRSEHERHLCRECAEICEQCAKDCEALGDMDECVAQCRACAKTCRAMAG